MDAKRTLSISEARKRIFEIAEEVQKPDTHFTLTENGRPKAVIISAEEFESLLETIEVLEEFPDFPKDIAETERDFASGAYKNYPTLEEILAKEGYVVADKTDKKYDVSRPLKAKGAKRARRSSAKK